MDIRIKNYYCLIAGVLAILFAIPHVLNGQSAVLPTLVTDIALDTRITFTYVRHIITAENLVFGMYSLSCHFKARNLRSGLLHG